MLEPFTLKYSVMMLESVGHRLLYRVHTAVASPCPYLACLIFKVGK